MSAAFGSDRGDAPSVPSVRCTAAFQACVAVFHMAVRCGGSEASTWAKSTALRCRFDGSTCSSRYARVRSTGA